MAHAKLQAPLSAGLGTPVMQDGGGAKRVHSAFPEQRKGRGVQFSESPMSSTSSTVSSPSPMSAFSSPVQRVGCVCVLESTISTTLQSSTRCVRSATPLLL